MKLINKVIAFIRRLYKLSKAGKVFSKILKIIGNMAGTGLSAYDFYKKIETRQQKKR